MRPKASLHLSGAAFGAALLLTLSPAQLAGCKIPRIFHFMASAPPRGKVGKSGE